MELNICANDIQSSLCQRCASCCRIKITVTNTDSRYRKFLRAVGFSVLERLQILIQADGHHFEAALVVLFITALQVGQLSPAGSAPGGPEVDQHNLAAIAGPIEGESIYAVSELQMLANQIRFLVAGRFGEIEPVAHKFAIAALGEQRAELGEVGIALLGLGEHVDGADVPEASRKCRCVSGCAAK